MKNFLFLSLLAVAALATVSAGIRACLAARRPLLTFPPLVEKWEHYRTHHDAYQAVVLGTSRMRAAFDPVVFEAAAKREGVDVRAYNFGVPALNIREQREIIRRMVALDPPALTDVMMDAMPHQLATWKNITSTRIGRMLTLDRLRLSARDQWATLQPAPRRAVGSLFLAAATLHEHLAVGLLSRQMHGDTDEAIYRTDLLHQGYVPLDEETHPLITARRGRYLAAGERYAEMSECLRRDGAAPRPVPEDRYALLEETMAMLEPLAVRITIVLPPRWHDAGAYRTLAAELTRRFPHVAVIDLADPQADPELFDTAAWYDRGHLNGEGAIRFSRRLATEWARRGAR